MTDKQTHNNPQANATPAKHGLGLAGNLAKSFINSPLSPLLLVASLALGLMGLVLTPRQEDPQISVPMVDIFFSYPGASAEQVASLATDPLEKLMSEIPGVKHVYSRSQREGAIVTVQFKVGEQMGPSLVKLNDKIQSNLDNIPPGVSRPLIRPKGVDDVPIVTLTLWSQQVDESALRSLSLNVLQSLKQINNTAQSFIVGGRPEAIKVEVFPERLAGFGISLDQLAQTIRTANSERGVGSVESGRTTFTLYTGAFLRNAKDVESLMVGVSKGRPTYVRDVALVTDGTDDAKNVVSYYTGPAYGEQAHEGLSPAPVGPQLAPIGAPAVTIAVAKKAGSNGVTVANDILSYVKRLQGSLIPDNVHVEITRNYGKTANEKVNELIFKLFVVTAAVTVLIWMTLGLRAATVVLVVIPIVILVTVFAAFLLGYTIDRVSLFALIFSIGILVDDAIVVVENIYRRWLIRGECAEDCTIDAVREVGNPTILATFAVIAALLPMGFVSGMMGPYMEPIPALGSVAMLFSLFAAFIFTPWLAQRIRPSMAHLEKARMREHRQAVWLDALYRNILEPLLDSRTKGWIFAAALLAVFFSSLYMFATESVAVKMLPKDNKPEFNVTINMPAGTALPITANVAARLSEEVMKLPEVLAVQSYAGTASPFNFNGLVRHSYLRKQPWYGDIQVQLTAKGERDRTSSELADMAREMLTPIAKKMGARIEVVEMPPGPPVLQTMVAEIYGPDAKTRRQVAKDVRGLFAKAKTIVDEGSYLQAPFQSWRFVIDREKASRSGVSVENINRQLEMAMGGFKLGDAKTQRSLEPRFIYLQMPVALRGDLGRLGQLPIPSTSGNMIPLTELGRFEPFMVDDPVFHKDLRAVEYVTAEVTGKLGAPIYGILELEKLLDTYTAPDGARVATTYTGPPKTSLHSALEWTGEWTVTYETFRDMGLAFGVALILIYILVVWEFGNFITPAIVMVPIPLTLIGIIPGHWLFGAPFTATSMIGFIALAGIIVRNSILLVDFSRQAVLRGVDPRTAVINACATRTRPIIITALALVLGSSVILSDPIFQGMAISLMMGGLVSTILTLVVIPLGCVSFRTALIESAQNDTNGSGSGGKSDPDNGHQTPTTDALIRAEAARRSTSRLAGLASGFQQLATIIVMLGAAVILGLVNIVKTAFWAILNRMERRNRAAPSSPTSSAQAQQAPAAAPKEKVVATSGATAPAKAAPNKSAEAPQPVPDQKPATRTASNAKTSATKSPKSKTPTSKQAAVKKTPAKKSVAKKTGPKKPVAKKAAAKAPAAPTKKSGQGKRRGIRLKPSSQPKKQN